MSATDDLFSKTADAQVSCAPLTGSETPAVVLAQLKKTIEEEPPCIRGEVAELHKKLRGIMRNSAGRVPNEYALTLIILEDAAEVQRREEWAAKHKWQRAESPNDPSSETGSAEKPSTGRGA